MEKLSKCQQSKLTECLVSFFVKYQVYIILTLLFFIIHITYIA